VGTATVDAICAPQVTDHGGCSNPSLCQLSQWNFQAEPEALTILHNPVTFLANEESHLFSGLVGGSPITGSPSNLLDENNDEAVLS